MLPYVAVYRLPESEGLYCRGRDVASVREDVKLDVVFKEFMSSNNHMLLVRRAPDMPGAPDGEVVGLITLEDVMEELIQVRLGFAFSAVITNDDYCIFEIVGLVCLSNFSISSHRASFT
jgi:hypothetical protein